MVVNPATVKAVSSLAISSRYSRVSADKPIRAFAPSFSALTNPVIRLPARTARPPFRMLKPSPASLASLPISLRASETVFPDCAAIFSACSTSSSRLLYDLISASVLLIAAFWLLIAIFRRSAAAELVPCSAATCSYCCSKLSRILFCDLRTLSSCFSFAEIPSAEFSQSPIAEDELLNSLFARLI